MDGKGPRPKHYRRGPSVDRCVSIMTLIAKVTSWSAETPDGGFYAERETNAGQWWTLWKRKKNLGRYRGFAAVCATVAAMTATAAHSEPCLPTLESYASALQSRYGETVQAVGTMSAGRPLLMFANPETGSWTIVLQAPDGRYCSPASGENFTAVKAGDPA